MAAATRGAQHLLKHVGRRKRSTKLLHRIVLTQPSCSFLSSSIICRWSINGLKGRGDGSRDPLGIGIDVNDDVKNSDTNSSIDKQNSFLDESDVTGREEGVEKEEEEASATREQAEAAAAAGGGGGEHSMMLEQVILLRQLQKAHEHGDIRQIQQLYDNFKMKSSIPLNTILYNACIFAAAICKSPKDSRFFLEQMQQDGFTPDKQSWSSLCQAYANVGDLEGIMNVLEEMTMTSSSSSSYAIIPDAECHDRILGTLARANQLDKAFKILWLMQSKQFQPSLTSFNAMLRSCVRRANMKKAMYILQIMENKGKKTAAAAAVKPDMLSYSFALSACAAAHRADQAIRLLHQMEQNGVNPSTVSYNITLKACAKSKNNMSNEALNLLQEMTAKGIEVDNYSYNATIQSLSLEPTLQRSVQIIELIHEMRNKHIRLDKMTYDLAIHALDHTNQYANMDELYLQAVSEGVFNHWKVTSSPSPSPTSSSSELSELSSSQPSEERVIDLHRATESTAKAAFRYILANLKPRPGDVSILTWNGVDPGRTFLYQSVIDYVQHTFPFVTIKRVHSNQQMGKYVMKIRQKGLQQREH